MTAGRRFAARLGLLAILFQAILFGWHHHDVTFSGLGAPVVANPSAPPQAVDDEDGCEICQTLHHQIALTPDFVPAPAPVAVAARLHAGDVPYLPRSPPLAFHARAPPSA